MNDLVWQNKTKDLTLHCRKKPTPALLNLLARTVWGTRDVKYRIHDVPAILDGIREPYFLTLETNGALVGAVVASRKTMKIADRVCDAFFIAMIATDPSVIGLGYGPLLATKAKEYGLALLNEPGVVYLYVESTHKGSLRMHRSIGYRDIGLMQTKLFSRIYAKDDGAVKEADGVETNRAIRLLTEQYAGHALLDFEQSVLMGNYYILTVKEQIVAGAQIRRMHLSLEKLEGFGGFIALKVLSFLPHKAYSPKNFRFLRIGNIYVRPGYESALTRLLEALLARHFVHAAIVFLDRRSIVHKRIEAATRFGVFSRLTEESMNIFAAFKGLNDVEINGLTACPINVSPVDPM